VHRRLVVLVVLAAACFDDPPKVDEGESGDGYEEVAEAAAEVTCGDCGEGCPIGEFCDGVRFELFSDPGCPGTPATTIGAADECMTAPLFHSMQARMVDPLADGCAQTEGQVANERVCCLP
jgi:hypothetical protein